MSHLQIKNEKKKQILLIYTNILFLSCMHHKHDLTL